MTPNYYVQTPDINRHPNDGRKPLEDSHTNYFPFGNQALQWLGLNVDTALIGDGILIAILDTGVNEHPTLESRVIQRISLIDDGVLASGEYSGHGTAVASIIAGALPDAPGVAPAADIISFQVLKPDGVGDLFTLAKGIRMAVDSGADIINLSLGTYGHNPILAEAVDYAVSKNVAIIASTGNDGYDEVTYPARYPDVVAVTGVDALEQRLDFANSGPAVNMAAPGFAIQAAWDDDQTAVVSGTSFAVPFVVGAMALLYDDQVDVRDTVDLISNYSNDAGAPGWDPEYGDGIINIGRLQNRDVEGIHDIAVGHYLDGNGGDDAHLSFLVSAQNRGTEIAADIQLQITINDIPVGDYGFTDLRVGQTVSKELLIPVDEIKKLGKLEIRSVLINDGENDVNNWNNVRKSVIFLDDDYDKSGNEN